MKVAGALLYCLHYFVFYYMILCYVIPISYSIVLHIIRADIFLIARIIPRLFGGWKNTTQLGKYPRVLYEKPSNKIYIYIYYIIGVKLRQRLNNIFCSVLLLCHPSDGFSLKEPNLLSLALNHTGGGGI